MTVYVLLDLDGTLLGVEDEAVVAQAIAAYQERFGAVGLFENRVYPGIPELLGALRSRGCCASSPRSPRGGHGQRSLE